MLEDLTSSELTEWQAYDKIQPVADIERLEFSIAQLSALVLNIANGVWGRKGRSKTYTAGDFIPEWYKPKRQVKQQSTDEMKSILMTLVQVQKKGEKS